MIEQEIDKYFYFKPSIGKFNEIDTDDSYRFDSNKN